MIKTVELGYNTFLRTAKKLFIIAMIIYNREHFLYILSLLTKGLDIVITVIVITEFDQVRKTIDCKDKRCESRVLKISRLIVVASCVFRSTKL